MPEMTLAENLTKTPFEAIQASLERETPYVVVYPRNRARRALLSLALTDSNRRLYYYSLQDSDTDLHTWLHNLSTDDQFPTDFGEQVRGALDEKGVLPEDLAHAMAADLERLQSDRFAIILDELDRLIEDQENASRFFTELAVNIPTQAQIIVDGRQLRRQPWHTLILQGYAETIGDYGAINGGMFDRDVSDLGQVEFFSLSGNSRIVSDGRSIKSWDGSLPRNLCYYFIERKMVTRQEIFDTFWPHLGVKEATNVFHVTKRKISEKIGYDITAYSNGFYVPSSSVKLMYDARHFEALIEEAVSNPDEVNPAVWYQAIQLYRHPYLQGLDMPWIIEKRNRLKEGYVRALIGIGRFHKQLEEPNRALGYFLRAVAEQPNREDVHRDIMQLYYDADQLDQLVTQYRQLERILKRDYNLKPSKETQALYTMLTNA